MNDEQRRDLIARYRDMVEERLIDATGTTVAVEHIEAQARLIDSLVEAAQYLDAQIMFIENRAEKARAEAAE